MRFEIKSTVGAGRAVGRTFKRASVARSQGLPEMQLNVDESFDDLDIGESKKGRKICHAFVTNSP
jgi:hypothetical protein